MRSARSTRVDDRGDADGRGARATRRTDDAPRPTTRANNIIRTRLRSRFRSVDVARASVRVSFTHHRAMTGAVTTTRSNRARARPGRTDVDPCRRRRECVCARDGSRSRKHIVRIGFDRVETHVVVVVDRSDLGDGPMNRWGWWIWITPIDRSNGRDPRGGGTRGAGGEGRVRSGGCVRLR